MKRGLPSGNNIKPDDIITSSPSGIIVTDSLDIIVTVNEKAEEILGMRAERLIGKTISDLGLHTEIFRLLVKGDNVIVGRENGRKVLISRNLLNSHKNVAGMIYFIHDISGLEANELQSMHDMNCKLESLIESSHDGIILTDHEKILKVNSSYLRISGLKKEKVEGVEISRLSDSPHI